MAAVRGGPRRGAATTGNSRLSGTSLSGVPNGQSSVAPRGPRDLWRARFCLGRRSDELQEAIFRMLIAKVVSTPVASSTAAPGPTYLSCMQRGTNSSSMPNCQDAWPRNLSDAARPRYDVMERRSGCSSAARKDGRSWYFRVRLIRRHGKSSAPRPFSLVPDLAQPHGRTTVSSRISTSGLTRRLCTQVGSLLQSGRLSGFHI